MNWYAKASKKPLNCFPSYRKLMNFPAMIFLVFLSSRLSSNNLDKVVNARWKYLFMCLPWMPYFWLVATLIINFN
ncbi:hypothetical protein Peur_067323 [Populus x canadensis]